MTLKKLTASPAAPGVPFYTPHQDPPAGTALKKDSSPVPTVFTPLTIRGLTLQNRFAVSPMCMYSANNGHLTDFHLVHLGQYALHGTPLTIVEATAVTPNGRISPEDSGLWQDSQIAPLKRVTDFIHSQGQKVGIQLAHAGRKASTLAPWHYRTLGKEVATEELGGWPDNLWAPSPIPWAEGFPTPKEMTLAQIQDLIQAWKSAASRAVKAGVDLIEIHGAHGYLLTEFLSPITNQRTDQYGGAPFPNRIRLLLEIITAIRSVIPPSMPLFLRISATEWMSHSSQSWDLAQSKKLASLVADLGVDLLDVSSGGNNPDQKIEAHPYYQIDLASEIREHLRKEGKKMLIGAVGMVTSAEMARDVVQGEEGDETVEVVDGEHGTKARADLVLVARQYLREPEFVLKVAAELGVGVRLPLQYSRAPFPKKKKGVEQGKL
ncbi:putative NADPH dehydrogenase [Triangularia verruculosa]|uniref:NADPH dehydrogenase n=1 Tax=Triangularia verruculosa TaxID=2587418 RepID=A0AAN6XQZ6_9PEZI|nr:putative NADPH dehydrogenase [Triangularia verruculosa]